MVEGKYEAASKQKLLAAVKRKFNTTMIGALAEFEKTFGHLWRTWKDSR